MNQFASSSSSNLTTSQGKHDVFISFRGKDTCYNFTSHLLTALTKMKIPTFIDEVDLMRGEEISPSLLKVIEESKIAIVILSENYASSKWCLEELVKILDCMRNNGLMVIPVFYRVDPSHVHRQTVSFADAFVKHEKGKDRVQKWRAALTNIAKLSGYDLPPNRSESELIEKITEDVLTKLNNTSIGYYQKGLVGIESRIQHIKILLSLESSYVIVVGIWGMGGLGKTTLARAIYDQISVQFESCSFLADAREQVKTGTLAQLKNELFSALLEEGNASASKLNLRESFVRDRLRRKKVLVVVDDVNNSIQQQELLLLLADLFGPGSRILVTSRDKQVLKNTANAIYTMEKLNEDEALQLFSMKAFKQDCPPSDRVLQVQRVVNYAKGNPLALRVLGSALLERSDEDWDSMLKNLTQIPNSDIYNVLKTSYDGLDSKEQSIFLDIACFFRGQSREYVTKILDGFDSSCSSVHFAITILIDKSLIMLNSDNVLEMHDLLQEMGRKIVVDECRQPQNRSRLWNPKDVRYVLMENKGNEAIEGISLDMSMVREIHLEPDVFTKMHGLRFLEFFWPDEDFGRYGEEKLHLSHQGLRSLPENLRYLHWTKFPLKSIPSKFFSESLVVLRLRDSKVKKLWDGVQNLANLIEIDLSESQYLTGIPDLSKAIKIETIKLNGCVSLVEVHSSIQYLYKLEFFDVEGCEKLKNLPRRIESKALKVLNMIGCPRVERCPEITQVNMQQLSLDCAAMTQVPESVLLLSTVSVLYVTNCRKVSSLPRNFCKLKYLRMLSLRKWSELESFPEILEPMNLVELDLRDCRNLRRLPDSIYNLKSLQILSLGRAGIQEIPSSIEHLSSLVTLELKDCRYLESLPSCIHRLSRLRHLHLRRCKSLSSLPDLPTSLEDLRANDCISLQTLPSNFRKCCNLYFSNFANCSRLNHKALEAEAQFITLNRHRYGSLLYPGSEVPEWFTHQSTGSSVTIQFPLNWDPFKGVIFCIICEFRKPSEELYCFDLYNLRFKMDPVDPDNSGEVRDGFWSYPCPYIRADSDHVLIVYQSDNPFQEYSASLSSFQFCPYVDSGERNNVNTEILKHCKVKKCGVHLLRDGASIINSQTASSSTSPWAVIAPRVSAAATAGIFRRHHVGSSAASASTISSGGIGISKMVKICPIVVLVMILWLIGFATALHVFGKFYPSRVAHRA